MPVCYIMSLKLWFSVSLGNRVPHTKRGLSSIGCVTLTYVLRINKSATK